MTKATYRQPCQVETYAQVRDPQLVRPLGTELPVDSVEQARRLVVTDRRAQDFASHHTLQSAPAHQSFHRAARHGTAFTAELSPDLVVAIDLHVGLPDALDLRRQRFVASSASAALFQVAAKGCVPSVSRRGDRQNLADWLDPVSVAVLVDEVPQDLSRRSSSAWAKNALASFGSRWPGAAPCSRAPVPSGAASRSS